MLKTREVGQPESITRTEVAQAGKHAVRAATRRSVGNQRLSDLKSEGIEAEAKGRTEQKVAEKTRRTRNGSIGLGEVPAPQFIPLYTQLQIKFVYSIDRKNGNKIIKPKLSFSSIRRTQGRWPPASAETQTSRGLQR